MRLVSRTGCIPSPLSPKDKNFPLASLGFGRVKIPIRFSLEEFVERIDDQENKPWCVCFAICNAVEFQMKKMGISVPVGGFSKAFLYALCKKLDGSPSEPGTQIKIALLIAMRIGLCPDFLCPTEFWLKQDKLPEISDEMLEAASQYRIDGFSRLMDDEGYADLYQMKQTIASGGFVIVATLVEQDNWLDNDDLLLVPKGKVLGAHCTYGFDYDDEEVKVDKYIGFIGDANSWGTNWGRGGKCDMSYAYAEWRGTDGMPALLEAWAFKVSNPQKKVSIYETVKRILGMD